MLGIQAEPAATALEAAAKIKFTMQRQALGTDGRAQCYSGDD